jgi:hypothetical protein
MAVVKIRQAVWRIVRPNAMITERCHPKPDTPAGVR